MKAAFPNFDLDIEIFVKQPQSLIQQGFSDPVYLLQKALCGLKQLLSPLHKMTDLFYYLSNLSLREVRQLYISDMRTRRFVL